MKKTIINAANRFKGFCFDYDKYRPNPPKDIFEIAIKMSKDNKPSLVVDLGCGSGLSTRPWGDYAEKVIGIEPSEDMLSVALATSNDKNLEYIKGTGEDTGLKSQSVDIVTASSAIHWMEPLNTVKEISRILRDNGVLLIYGHYYPVYADSIAPPPVPTGTKPISNCGFFHNLDVFMPFNGGAK
jgi:ubiquinone/menaquinone biosynthesis C-methylase UbiE